MIFNSTTFLIFFTVFFIIYWFVLNKNLRAQNIFILIASYFFYAWWDWRFLPLLIGTSALNYILGNYIFKTPIGPKRKPFLFLGVLVGIGTLAYFKYTNFFIASVNDSAARFNYNLNIPFYKIILPLGISFYTFRALSYLFDINKGKIKPADDWVVFFSYVAFFPSLISGPIDKSSTLIPQLKTKREFDYDMATDGLRQILWGLFKKVVIADNCADLTNHIFAHYSTLPASSLLLGAFYYTIQIYADFSGYSDMAIGVAHLFGFNITRNFEFPFFAQNIAEFWRRWHMSLTTWLTDYVFTPLAIAFRDYDNWGTIWAILINFTLIGIWHGASWTFVLFGFLHGCYYIPLIISGSFNKKRKVDKTKKLPTLIELRNMVGTFVLVMLTFVLFRSENLKQAFSFWGRLFSKSLFSYPAEAIPTGSNLILLVFIATLLIVEWIQRFKQHALQFTTAKYPVLRWSVYFVLFILYLYNVKEDSQFIYFKF